MRPLSQEFARTVIKEAINIFELCQTGLQELHIEIILLSLQLTHQENTILKQTSFLKDLSITQNGH